RYDAVFGAFMNRAARDLKLAPIAAEETP
ncbi:MAG: homoserine O-acetyltransferase MetX, partial [Halomonas sp. HL-93]